MPKYRYPTSVKWGPGYKDSYREIEAQDDEDALRQTAGFGITIDHLQRCYDGRWQFATDLRAGPQFAQLTTTEAAVAREIARRAQTMLGRFGVDETVSAIMMDLATVHHARPLDFAQLLAFGDGDFGHDIGQIRRHLDRETGTVPGWFDPRCSRITPADLT